MQLYFKYRSNSFFNKEDTFVFFDSAYDKVLSSKVEFSNGNWWLEKGLKQKATTLKSDNLTQQKHP